MEKGRRNSTVISSVFLFPFSILLSAFRIVIAFNKDDGKGSGALCGLMDLFDSCV